MKNLLSTNELKKKEAEEILFLASIMEKECGSGQVRELLKDKIIASIFFEPSTRTRLSFETAALKLGGKVISVENALDNSSAYKGETIEDTTRMLDCYADAIVLRHPTSGAAIRAANVSEKPVINAGDGANQHPSQGLLDLYTIKKELGKLENLSVAFVGDLLYSRPLHSLVPLLMNYPGNKFYFISPKELRLAEDFKKTLREKEADFEESQNLEEILPKVDVLYITRVQKERFDNVTDYEKIKDSFLLAVKHLEKLKKEAVIMHALPRVNEIEKAIDADRRAAYFRQAGNGLYVRMAILLWCLEIK